MSGIALKSVSVALGGKEILKNISFELEGGKILGILGANGSGKSTLLRAILGLVAYRGKILANGIDTATLSRLAHSRLMSYVPQMSNIIFPFSLLEVVLMGRYARSSMLSYAQNDINRAMSQLESFDIAHLANEYFSSLSGGQRQLGLIARALIQDSEIIILDEPVSALDMSYSFKLLGILEALRGAKTIIITSHHPEQLFIADFVLMLKNGEILHYESRENALTESHINALYGVESRAIALPNGGTYFCQMNERL